MQQELCLTSQDQVPRLWLNLANLWQIKLVDAAHPDQSLGTVSAADNQAVMESMPTPSGVRLTWRLHTPCRLEVQVEIEQEADCWQLHASIVNHSPAAIVDEFAWSGLDLPTQGGALLFPQGAGRRVSDFEALSIPTVQYPSYQCSMPWLAMEHETGGVYVGRHDPDDHAMDVSLSWNPKTRTLNASLTQFPYLRPGQQTSLPPLVCTCYRGHWSRAAAFYRQWFDGIGPVAAIPQWLKTNSGWLLGILRQQNESLNYDYLTGIDELADIALSRGLDTLGLFGWTAGGHDHLYPHYDPDPKMGGCDALKSAIKRARERGLRVILYSNGVIMDVASSFYREHGKDACSINHDGRVNLSQINKFSDATPVVFSPACPGSKQWREAMLGLAIQAYELGADGLLYDQIGVYGRQVCRHPDHDHANPMQGYTTGRVTMMRQIAEHMRQLDPDFIIATESFIAPLARQLHLIHGFGYAYGLPGDDAACDELFPDMLRLTFPEVVVTNRIPQPLFDRRVGHYAVLHGLRQELEIRYAEDVRLARGETLDWRSAYATAIGAPPRPHKLKQAISEAEKCYMAKLMAFCKQHADVFYHGVYQADLGFDFASQTLQARAYATGTGALGILLWNPTDRDGSFEVAVVDRRLAGAYAPDGEVATGLAPLPPQSIRLLIYSASNRNPT